MISKKNAGYAWAELAARSCSVCSMFRDGSCTLVRGEISPSATCDYFDPKKGASDDKASVKVASISEVGKNLGGDEAVVAKNAPAASAGGPHIEGEKMTDNVRFFLPISKVDKKKRTVSGYASTETRDMDGEIVALDAVKKALPGYMAWGNIREMHRLVAVGAAEEAHVDGKGLFLTAKIVDDSAWAKCISDPPVYNGFSIGGRKLAKVGDTITELDLTEISIVDRPANPDCRISVAKSAGAGVEAHLTEAKEKRTAQDKALVKAGKIIALLSKAGPPAAHDGFSLPAKPAAKEPEPAEKREVSQKERESLADSGDANPDGSFPIKNKSDLANAIKAYGRSSNKPATKKLIMRRARELGAEDMIPEKWAKKIAKAAAKRERKREALLKRSAALPYLTLKADGSSTLPREAVPRHDGIQPGDRLVLPSEGRGAKPKKLKKSMRVAGDLACAFDAIRGSQRSLMMESSREGGDKKDAKLAKELGPVAQKLAEIISLKSSHEGEEALDFSDADDRYLFDVLGGDFAMAQTADPIERAVLDIVKRATTPTRAARMGMAQKALKNLKAARKECAAAIEDAHKMVKAAYIAKAGKTDGKKPKDDDDDDDFDHAGMMEKLQKAYGAIQKVRTFGKAAETQLKKAAGRSGQRGQEAGDPESGFFEVPAGVKDLSPAALAGARPGTAGAGSQPPSYPDSGQVYPGKAAMARFAKNGQVPIELVEVITENARLTAANEALSRAPAMPAGGRRPYSFDMSKLAGGGGGREDDTAVAHLRKAVVDSGVNVHSLASDDPGSERDRGKVIGQYILGTGAGRSVLDASFHGTAGIKNRSAA